MNPDNNILMGPSYPKFEVPFESSNDIKDIDEIF